MYRAPTAAAWMLRMREIGNFAGGQGVWNLWSELKIFAFQAGIAVDVCGDVSAFGKGDVFSMHHWNNHTSRRAGALGFAAGA